MLNSTRVHISVDSWVPLQHPTPLKLRKMADCYDQRCLKFRGTGVFHSRAELLHTALLEGDPSVEFYMPQPFCFRVGSRLYTPDCYVKKNNTKFIYELKPRGEFKYEWHGDFEKYCNLNGYQFEVIANEQVLEQEQLAENWLTILRILARCAEYNSDKAETEILHHRLAPGTNTFSDLIQHSDTFQKFILEIAALRLLHAGKLAANLRSSPLDYETEFELCI